MSLKNVGAYLLANLAGHENPTVEEIEKILKSVGCHIDHASIETLVAELKGKNVHQVIASGKTKLFSGAFAAAAAPAGKAAASGSPKKGAAPKKEEPKEEEEEAGAFSLFD